MQILHFCEVINQSLKQKGGYLSDKPSRSTDHQNNRRYRESFFEGCAFCKLEGANLYILLQS